MTNNKITRFTRDQYLVFMTNNRSRGQFRLGSFKMYLAVFILSLILIQIFAYLAMTWPTPIRVPRRKTRLEVEANIRTVLNLSVINPFNYAFTIVPRTLCKEGTIIFVASAPHHFAYRDAIRRTWGQQEGEDADEKPRDAALVPTTVKTQNGRSDSQNGSRVSDRFTVLFFLGDLVGEDADSELLREKVWEESDLNGDIAISDFQDTYDNLSLKTMSMLLWAVQFCPAKNMYFVKCDDDTFFNVPLLLTALREADTTEHFVVGHMLKDLIPYRDSGSKYYVSVEEYRDKMYPPGLSGSAYAMKMQTAHLIYKVALRTKLFRLEDIYILGMCAGRIGIDLVRDSRFSLNRHLYECEQADYVSGHEYSPTQMLKVYEQLQSQKCRSEILKKQQPATKYF